MKKTIIDIEAMKIKLTDIDKYIIEKINSSPEIFILGNIKSISSKIDVSISALSRFSKKMKYLSFSDLRIMIATEVTRVSKYYDVKLKNEWADGLKTIASFSVIENISNKKIEKQVIAAAETIAKKDTILIYGIESSSLAGMELSSNLNKIGYDARFTNLFDTLISWNATKNNSVIIIFSHSMKSNRAKLISELKCKKRIIITAVKDSFNGDGINYENINIDFVQKEMGAKYAQLIIGDMLFMEMATKDKFEKVNNLARKVIKNI